MTSMENKEIKMNQRNWSDLPELLLWMIIGRLNLLDKLRFGGVSTTWRTATKNCPESFKLDVDEREPWIMVETVSKTEREFVNISADNKPPFPRFILDNEDLQGATLKSSRDGWLLFTKIEQRPPRQHSVFFLNALTKSVIKMPCYDATCITMATFSIHGNAPHRVILAVSTIHLNLDHGHSSFTVTLAIANPGDDKWMEFHYTTQQLITEIFRVGQHVICFDGNRRLLEFDLVNHTWHESQLILPSSTLQRKEWGNVYNIKNKGEVFKVHVRKCSVDCFMLDEVKTAWLELKKKDLRGNAWYLDGKSNFMVKGGREKVYEIMNMCRKGWRITVQDLHNNRVEQEVLSQILEKENTDEVGQAYWVDLG